MAFSHSPQIVTSGLRYAIDFSNPLSYPQSGASVFNLAQSNTSTLVNSPSWNSGNMGRIVWDGTDDYLDTGRTATQFGFYNANYTMEAWVYPTNLSGDRTMFGTDQTEFRKGLHLVFRNGVIYQGHYSADFSAGTVDINNWYQILYTYNASNGACEIYKNAVSQGTGTISSFIGDTNILIARWATGQYFVGNGGNYKIYDRVLSSAEVSQNFNVLRTKYGI
jgi:hypothetical protein